MEPLNMLPYIAKLCRYNLTKDMRWEDYHALSHGFKVFKTFLLNERTRQQNRTRKSWWWKQSSERTNNCWPWRWKCVKSLGILRKWKENKTIHSPLDPPEGMLLTTWLLLSEPKFRFTTSRKVKVLNFSSYVTNFVIICYSSNRKLIHWTNMIWQTRPLKI